MSDQPTQRQPPVNQTGQQPAQAQPAQPARQPFVMIDSRGAGDHSRTSPRMRFDLLQIAAWALGIGLVIAGLVAIARAGFENLEVFDPVVQVAGISATPLMAVLILALGVALLAAGTGSVDDQRLRISGVVLGVIGAVWMIEPGAFEPYLGIDADTGTATLALGIVLVAASFVPPLSISRPGVPQQPR